MTPCRPGRPALIQGEVGVMGRIHFTRQSKSTCGGEVRAGAVTEASLAKSTLKYYGWYSSPATPLSAGNSPTNASAKRIATRAQAGTDTLPPQSGGTASSCKGPEAERSRWGRKAGEKPAYALLSQPPKSEGPRAWMARHPPVPGAWEALVRTPQVVCPPPIPPHSRSQRPAQGLVLVKGGMAGLLE